MDKDILNEVIEAEKEIHRCIELEQDRLRVWLDQVKKESAEAVSRAEQDDGDSLSRAVEAAKRDAEQRARRAVEAAEARAARFTEQDDAALARVMLKRMPRILLG